MGVAEHLMGAGEIRDRLGRPSRQRVYQITTDPSFPKPYDELQMGRAWRIEDVEAWITRMQDDRDNSRMRRGVRRIDETREAAAEEE
jgi:predicted DNA-binding transcriptional regulator AlpA